mmetsp:Transcript_22744/g.59948  ORF Transcript_22744/g.59948 Transcript_22744/m.59948 type:complete len:514 (-) Transcript_22744:464-2005(-)
MLTFEADLRRTPGPTFGIDIVLLTSPRGTSRLVVTRVAPRSCADVWNKRSQDPLRIRPRDTILRVNGVSGDAHNLADELTSSHDVRISLQRPLRLSLGQSSTEGEVPTPEGPPSVAEILEVTISRREGTNLGLQVLPVVLSQLRWQGLHVQRVSVTPSATRNIMPGDCIINVSGVAGDINRMMNELRTQRNLRLVIFRLRESGVQRPLRETSRAQQAERCVETSLSIMVQSYPHPELPRDGEFSFDAEVVHQGLQSCRLQPAKKKSKLVDPMGGVNAAKMEAEEEVVEDTACLPRFPVAMNGIQNTTGWEASTQQSIIDDGQEEALSHTSVPPCRFRPSTPEQERSSSPVPPLHQVLGTTDLIDRLRVAVRGPPGPPPGKIPSPQLQGTRPSTPGPPSPSCEWFRAKEAPVPVPPPPADERSDGEGEHGEWKVSWLPPTLLLSMLELNDDELTELLGGALSLRPWLLMPIKKAASMLELSTSTECHKGFAHERVACSGPSLVTHTSPEARSIP